MKASSISATFSPSGRRGTGPASTGAAAVGRIPGRERMRTLLLMVLSAEVRLTSSLNAGGPAAPFGTDDSVCEPASLSFDSTLSLDFRSRDSEEAREPSESPGMGK